MAHVETLCIRRQPAEGEDAANPLTVNLLSEQPLLAMQKRHLNSSIQKTLINDEIEVHSYSNWIIEILFIRNLHQRQNLG